MRGVNRTTLKHHVCHTTTDILGRGQAYMKFGMFCELRKKEIGAFNRQEEVGRWSVETEMSTIVDSRGGRWSKFW